MTQDDSDARRGGLQGSAAAPHSGSMPMQTGASDQGESGVTAEASYERSGDPVGLGPAPGRRITRTRLLQYALGFLLLAHLVQIFSPMRLDLDATSYLNRTVAIVEGHSFGPMWLPPGYSYMLAGLEIIGIGNSWVFAGLNWLFLGLGIGASYYVLRREIMLSRNEGLIICCMTLLSFVIIKYAPMPLGDTAYFGLSMLFLAMLSRIRQGLRPVTLSLVIATLIALVAVSTRTIGVTLAAGIASLVWSQRAEWIYTRSESDRPFRKGLFPLAGILFIGAGVAAVVLNSHYFSQVVEVWSASGYRSAFLQVIEARFNNWGEVFLNSPRTIAPDAVEFAYFMAAIMGSATVAYGIWKNRGQWGLAHSYFAAYFLALLIYPGPQTRYWLPVLPLMFAWAMIAARSLRNRPLRVLPLLYLGGYCLTGVGALYYSTRITLSGTDVGRRFGDGTYSNAYDAAFLNKPVPPTDTWTGTHDSVLIFLRRYDPRIPAD